jgi:hypothetical protein
MKPTPEPQAAANHRPHPGRAHPSRVFQVEVAKLDITRSLPDHLLTLGGKDPRAPRLRPPDEPRFFRDLVEKIDRSAPCFDDTSFDDEDGEAQHRPLRLGFRSELVSFLVSIIPILGR